MLKSAPKKTPILKKISIFILAFLLALAGISFIDKNTNFLTKVGPLIAQVVGNPLTNKFLDSALPDFATAGAQVTGAYQNISGDVAISGNVGIGITDPGYTLEVGGNGAATTPYSTFNGLRISGGDTSNTIWNAGRDIAISANTGHLISLSQTSSHTTGLTVNTTNGNVGIGTTTPGAKLDVNGPIKTLGSSIFAQDNNTNTEYWTAPIQVREAQYGATGAQKPPRISFHWGGVVASQIGIESSGRIAVLNNPGTGYENFIAQDITAGATGNRSASVGRLYLNSGDWHPWGTSIIDGRVWSANSDIYLSPPNGYNVYINTGYRDAGGSTGTAGLDASGAITSHSKFTATDGSVYADMWPGGITSTRGIMYWTNPNCPAWYYFNFGGVNRYRFGCDNVGYSLGGWAAGAIDYAEYFPGISNLEKGTIVATTDDQIKEFVGPTNGQYQKNLVGVVSTSPGFIGGNKMGEKKGDILVGLAGRLPVIVSSENGFFQKGDLITSSSLPGVGMKAKKAGYIVGKSLESSDNWNEQSCPLVSSPSEIKWPEDDGGNPSKPCARLSNGTYIGKVMMFINTSWSEPDANLQIRDVLLSDNYQLKNKEGDLIDKVGAFAEIIVGKLKVGLLEAQKLIVNGVDILEKMNQLEDTVKKQQETINKLQEEIEALKGAK